MAEAAQIHHKDTEVTEMMSRCADQYAFAFILTVLGVSVVRIYAKQSQFRDSPNGG